MLEFRDIDISDRERINKALAASGFRGCEYCFANNMAWKRLGGSKIAFYKEHYISGTFETADGIPRFIFPSGSGDIRETLGEMLAYTESSGQPLKLTGVTEDLLPLLTELFPGRCVYEFDRDSSDYIYRASDLISLAGKKYHAKRNHFARFSENDYEFSLITEADFDDCITFLTNDYNNRAGSMDYSMIAEQYAINTFFSYYGEFGLKGALIRIGGKIAAVTIGESICADTFGVHIEKADTSYAGVYAGINKLFAGACASGHEYINREEDMGIEGLRKAKLSYHPVFLLRKFNVTIR